MVITQIVDKLVQTGIVPDDPELRKDAEAIVRDVARSSIRRAVRRLIEENEEPFTLLTDN